jgi:hypothetical protein
LLQPTSLFAISLKYYFPQKTFFSSGESQDFVFGEVFESIKSDYCLVTVSTPDKSEIIALAPSNFALSLCRGRNNNLLVLSDTFVRWESLQSAINGKMTCANAYKAAAFDKLSKLNNFAPQ